MASRDTGAIGSSESAPRLRATVANPTPHKAGDSGIVSNATSSNNIPPTSGATARAAALRKGKTPSNLPR